MAHIDDWLAENYHEVREQRGLTWDEMADDFKRQGATRLETWARDLAKASASRASSEERAAKPRARRAATPTEES